MQDLKGLLRIMLQLCLQLTDGVKLDFLTQSADEVQLHVLPVEVAVEVEEVGFDGAVVSVVNGGAPAYVEHGVVLLAVCFGPYRIDSVGRDDFLWRVRQDVGRRKTQLPPQPVALNHRAVQGKRVSQSPAGGLYIAGLQKTPYGRRGNTGVLRREGVRLDDSDARFAAYLQIFLEAAAVGPEVVVVAEQKLPDV